MPLNDLEEQILLHLQDLIQRGMPYIYENLSQRHLTTGTPPAPPEIKIVIGEKVVVGHFPVIRISSSIPMESRWMATGVREDKYSCNIDVDVKIAKKEIEDKFVMAVSNATKNWLLWRDNLSGTIFNTGVSYYDSWSESTSLGVKGDGSIRTARFIWWCKVANTYEYAYST